MFSSLCEILIFYKSLISYFISFTILYFCILYKNCCAKLLSLTLCNSMDCSPPDFSVHGIFQARILTRVGCHALLQRIFQTQGLNPCLFLLLHWQADSLQLHHLVTPNILPHNVVVIYGIPTPEMVIQSDIQETDIQLM